jgi:hypothetical protein
VIVWPAKDPSEHLDYTWGVPLDAGDSIVSYTAAAASGTATKDSDALSGGNVTLWISGGTDGESATFTLTATTTAGRTFREVAILPIFDRASEMLAMFRLRYPEFVSVADGLIGYWLADAGITDGWLENDRDPARLALAAHNLSLAGQGASGGPVANLAAMGVTSFRSAGMSANFAESVVSARAKGGYGSTRYGRDFQVYLRRNAGGPSLMGCL